MGVRRSASFGLGATNGNLLILLLLVYKTNGFEAGWDEFGFRSQAHSSKAIDEVLPHEANSLRLLAGD